MDAALTDARIVDLTALTEKQREFYTNFPETVTPIGMLRRKLGLARVEWHDPPFPPDNERYKAMVLLTNELIGKPKRVQQLLNDETAFKTYVAELRLLGA